MIKAVIFDYGGVIKDGRRLSKDVAEIYDISDEEVQKSREKTKSLVSQFDKGLIREEDFWRNFSDIIGKPVPEGVMELFRHKYRKHFVFFEEMFDLIKDLKSRGIKTAVLSNILVFQADVIREKEGYKDFDLVILSYEEGLEKPDMDIYHLALKRLGLKPKECIFIDDKEENLLPARSLGIKTILAKSPKQVVKDVYNIINL